MPKVTIPDKICPKCGGTEWYERVPYPRTGKKHYICVECMRKYRVEYSKQYRYTPSGYAALERARQRERDRLTNNYIRQHIYVMALRDGVKIVRKAITEEQIEKYRQVLMAERKLSEIKYDTQHETTKGNRRKKLRDGQQSLPDIHDRWRYSCTDRSCESIQVFYAGSEIPNYVYSIR